MREIYLMNKELEYKLFVIFFSALALNFIWEEAHSALYAHYRGAEITHFVLLRAALVDALVITGLLFPFFKVNFLKKRIWIFPVGAVAIAIGLEKWALSTGRWAYTDAMPVIPILDSGLTPTIQLAFLGYVSYLVGMHYGLRRSKTTYDK